MLRKIKAMFGISSQKHAIREDPVSVQVAVAVRRNEQAGERARDVIKEMLERNDSFKDAR